MKTKLWRGFLWALLLVYLGLLLRITVFRDSFGSHPLLQDGKILWVPFVELFRIARNSTSFFLYLFLGNLVWFVPLGLLLPLLTGCGRWVILWSLLLSLFIEVCQFIFGTGVSETEDLILNTLGGAIGYGIYCLITRWGNRKKRDLP